MAPEASLEEDPSCGAGQWVPVLFGVAARSVHEEHVAVHDVLQEMRCGGSGKSGSWHLWCTKYSACVLN